MNQLQKERESSVTTQSYVDSSPFLEWTYQYNDKTGEQELDSIQLSDGSKHDSDKLKQALKKASGTSDPKTGERVLKKIAKGLSSDRFDQRINEASALLPSLEPKNTTEALLLGQFLALNDSGMKCLHLANRPDQGFYHVEKLFTLAHKLLNTANQTMQTILKYRSGGQQTVQVIHVHNEGQAIVAQNVSSHSKGQGQEKKSETEPHGSL